ncbi:hypothetical protein RF11_08391 [Thelohanellus kitauei]|uniref:Reverse transcriptase domain-containing protein n=1 Tax=Thelohanellus kitauei TaxID=669202 RepID=A0A0C2MK31_THEKT|nr:hypothetical protein RF11_08391 [Thelohanellus kitauei]
MGRVRYEYAAIFPSRGMHNSKHINTTFPHLMTICRSLMKLLLFRAGCCGCLPSTKIVNRQPKTLALSTHRGVLLQTRLPFRISSAPGYFQEIIEKLNKDLRGVAVYLDDILVYGSSEE